MSQAQISQQSRTEHRKDTKKYCVSDVVSKVVGSIQPNEQHSSHNMYAIREQKRRSGIESQTQNSAKAREKVSKLDHQELKGKYCKQNTTPDLKHKRDAPETATNMSVLADGENHWLLAPTGLKLYGDRTNSVKLDQGMLEMVDDVRKHVGGPFEDELLQESNRLKRTMLAHQITNSQFEQLVGQDKRAAQTQITLISQKFRMNVLWIVGLLSLSSTNAVQNLTDLVEDTTIQCTPLVYKTNSLYPMLRQCGVLRGTEIAKWVEDLLLNKAKEKNQAQDTAWEALTKLTESVHETTGKDIMMSTQGLLLQQATQGKEALEDRQADGWRLAAPDGSLANKQVAAGVFMAHNHEQSTVLPLTGTRATVTRAEQYGVLMLAATSSPSCTTVIVSDNETAMLIGQKQCTAFVRQTITKAMAHFQPKALFQMLTVLTECPKLILPVLSHGGYAPNEFADQLANYSRELQADLQEGQEIDWVKVLGLLLIAADPKSVSMQRREKADRAREHRPSRAMDWKLDLPRHPSSVNTLQVSTQFAPVVDNV